MSLPSVGSLTIFRTLSLVAAAQAVKNASGALYGGMVTNNATSVRWIKFYNTLASGVIVGTTVPIITWGLPGQTTGSVAAILGAAGQNGLMFSVAISVACTTGLADADTGAPAANDVVANFFWI